MIIPCSLCGGSGFIASGDHQGYICPLCGGHKPIPHQYQPRPVATPPIWSNKTVVFDPVQEVRELKKRVEDLENKLKRIQSA